MAVIELIKMEPGKRSNTKWANNVLFQLKNAIGENEKLNTKKRLLLLDKTYDPNQV